MMTEVAKLGMTNEKVLEFISCTGDILFCELAVAFTRCEPDKYAIIYKIFEDLSIMSKLYSGPSEYRGALVEGAL